MVRVLPYCAFFLPLSEQPLQTVQVLREEDSAAMSSGVLCRARRAWSCLTMCPLTLAFCCQKCLSPSFPLLPLQTYFLECFHDLEREMEWRCCSSGEMCLICLLHERESSAGPPHGLNLHLLFKEKSCFLPVRQKENALPRSLPSFFPRLSS